MVGIEARLVAGRTAINPVIIFGHAQCSLPMPMPMQNVVWLNAYLSQRIYFFVFLQILLCWRVWSGGQVVTITVTSLVLRALMQEGAVSVFRGFNLEVWAVGNLIELVLLWIIAMQSILGIILAFGLASCLIKPVAADSDTIPSVPSLVFGAVGLALVYFFARGLYLYNSDSKEGREYRRSWSEWNRKRKAVSSCDIKQWLMMSLLSTSLSDTIDSCNTTIFWKMS